MTTKEKILKEALELFAVKGYDGVSVREIAGAVGVRESALYKHFKNKEDILNNIIDATKERIAGAYIENQVPEAVEPDVAGGYRRLTTENLCEISWNLFQLYTKDPVVSNIRKLLMREQFSNSIIAKKYNQFFLNGVVERQAQTFAALVEDGFFRKEDTKIIALQFYGPIFLLFQRYDCEPEQEEAIKRMLYEHVRAFGRNYSRKEEQAL